jgi:hypothetical protein
MEFGRVTRHKDGGQEAEWGKDERGKEGRLKADGKERRAERARVNPERLDMRASSEPPIGSEP